MINDVVISDRSSFFISFRSIFISSSTLDVMNLPKRLLRAHMFLVKYLNGALITRQHVLVHKREVKFVPMLIERESKNS